MLNPYYSELYYKTKQYLEGVWKEIALPLKDKEGKDIEFTVNPYPIVWFQSPGKDDYNFDLRNLIYAPKFGFTELKYHLMYTYFKSKSFTSVYHWSQKNNAEAFHIIDEQVDRLIKQIEKDNKIGTLTKKKIDRLNRQYSEDLKIYEEFLESENNDKFNDLDSDNLFDLVFSDKNPKKVKTKLTARIEAEKGLNKNLVVISGKAGSGKTFEMLLLIKKQSENGKSSYYLTYNKLLANDVRNIVDNRKVVVKSLHNFFHRLSSEGLLITRFMSLARLKELKKINQERYKNIELYLSQLDDDKEFDLDKLYPDTHWDKGMREYFLLYKSHINPSINKKHKILIKKEALLIGLGSYNEKNLDTITSDLNGDIFSKDYPEVLRNILLARTDPDALYEKFNIDNLSDDVWEIITGDKTEYLKSKTGFHEMINRSFGGTLAKGRTLFLDEAQDCLALERDILLSIWRERNIVVCTGGKEQLIRHNQECNWAINGFSGRKIHNIIHIEKRNRTYRMKPALVKLCNFIADKFQINLDLSAHNTNCDDEGEVIIELNDRDYDKLKPQVEKLIQKEKENELTPYESILFMTESADSTIYKSSSSNHRFSIDDSNNIYYSKEKVNISDLARLTGIEPENIYFHNQKGINEKDNEKKDINIDIDRDKDKDKQSNKQEYATANTYRSILYESCRGLEAWSIVCLDIDLFFDRKRQEDIAATHFSDDLFLSEEERRDKYAATWVLMVLTRAIDTIYISANNKLWHKEGKEYPPIKEDNRLFKILQEYKKQ